MSNQRDAWEAEHRHPAIYHSLDGLTPSSGVRLVDQWLSEHGVDGAGVEMCCGKGRNVHWLARDGRQMSGIDFSETAIAVARSRGGKSRFYVHDATVPYPSGIGPTAFGLDCFGSTELRASQRVAAAGALRAVIEPGGLLFAYLNSTDDEYHAHQLATSPGPELDSFVIPGSGKFEHVFSEKSIAASYGELELLDARRVEQTLIVDGRTWQCRNHWRVYRV